MGTLREDEKKAYNTWCIPYRGGMIWNQMDCHNRLFRTTKTKIWSPLVGCCSITCCCVGGLASSKTKRQSLFRPQHTLQLSFLRWVRLESRAISVGIEPWRLSQRRREIGIQYLMKNICSEKIQWKLWSILNEDNSFLLTLTLLSFTLTLRTLKCLRSAIQGGRQ